MSVREIAGKIIAFLVAAGACAAAGILVLLGPHAASDIFNTFLGVTLMLLGLLILGVGSLVVAGILAEARLTRREQKLHIAPRRGAPGPPPAWGMGDVGRIGRTDRMEQITTTPPRGGGTVRVMSATMVNWDLPLIVGAALIWTALMTYWLAPH